MHNKLLDYEFSSVYLVEWSDGDLSIEDNSNMIILTPDEQKALRDYLNKKFSDQKEQK